MKSTIISLWMLLATMPLAAQSMEFGWFASAGGGIGQHDNGPFSRRLQSYTPSTPAGERFLYQTEPFSSIGYTLNGSLGVLVGGRFLIGASGESLTFPTVLAITSPGKPQDEYTLSGAGGGIDLGMTLYNDEGGIVYPFLHAGYYGYSLDFANKQSVAIPFFEGDTVSAGTTATYTGAAPRLGVGIGMTKIVGNPSAGSFVGMVINARLMYGQMIGRPEWEQNGTAVNNGGHTPAYNAISLSLSIGLGGGK